MVHGALTSKRAARCTFHHLFGRVHQARTPSLAVIGRDDSYGRDGGSRAQDQVTGWG